MLDSLYTGLQAVPWERSPDPGSLVMWTLFLVGGIFVALAAHDFWYAWKRKRPR